MFVTMGIVLFLHGNHAEALRFVQENAYNTQHCTSDVLESFPVYQVDSCMQTGAHLSMFVTCNNNNTITLVQWNNTNRGGQPLYTQLSSMTCTDGSSSTQSASSFNCPDIAASDLVEIRECGAYTGTYMLLKTATGDYYNEKLLQFFRNMHLLVLERNFELAWTELAEKSLNEQKYV